MNPAKPLRLRRRIAASLAVFPLLSLPWPAAAQRDFSNVEVRAQKLTPTTWMLVGVGGNIGLSAGDDAVFIIDDQFAPLAPKMKEAIAGITGKPVMATVSQRIESLRKAGRSDDEIRAAGPAAQFDAAFGNGFMKSDSFRADDAGIDWPLAPRAPAPTQPKASLTPLAR